MKPDEYRYMYDDKGTLVYAIIVQMEQDFKVERYDSSHHIIHPHINMGFPGASGCIYASISSTTSYGKLKTFAHICCMLQHAVTGT